MKRRNFLQTMGTAAAAVQFSPAVASSIFPNTNMNNNFKLKVLATNWGFNGTLDAYCAKVKKRRL